MIQVTDVGTRMPQPAVSEIYLLKCGLLVEKRCLLKRQRGAKVIQTQGKLIRKTPDERWNLDVHFTLPDGSLITHMVLSDHLYRR